MQTVFGVNKDFAYAKGTAVTIGNFDGVHLGHQKLFKTLETIAKEKDLSSVVYTFIEHPLRVLRGKNAVSLLCDTKQKEKLISEFHIDALIFEEFEKVKDLLPEAFVKEVLVDRLNIKQAVIGENNRFGKKSAGDAALLCRLGEKYGFSVEVIPSLCIDGEICSSSEIRKAIEEGDLLKATKLLGRPYRMTGEVIEGKHLGRTYGFPTANIIPKTGILLPKYGVYATKAWVDGKEYPAITNVGETSFDAQKIERIETHLIGFCGDIYGKEVLLDFLRYMRGFIKFASTDELKEQLKIDRETRLNITEEER